LGVSWDTIDRNRKRSAEFEDALKRGQAKGLAQVTNSLFTSATDGNVTAQIFYLKNQDPKTWKDRVENVHATINLNDVLSGAKERLGENMGKLQEPKIINAVKSTSTATEQFPKKDLKNKKGG
jgi:predicted GTPase